ncbi:MAG: hypothetical protein ACTSUV_01765 [Candidatus Ranarchaeia archaeon]
MKDGSLITVALTKKCIKEIKSAIKISHPKEAGGFLLGTSKQLRYCLTLPNISDKPNNEFDTHWEQGLEFAEHYCKWLDVKEKNIGKTEVRVFWHSHPGEIKAIPSSNIIEEKQTSGINSPRMGGDIGFLKSMNDLFKSDSVRLSMIVSYKDLRGGLDFTLMNSLQRIIPLRIPKPYQNNHKR